jgi:hypothetical protein
MNFSYSAVWDDCVRLIRLHFPLVVAVAGVFIFLPNLLLGHLVPQPQPTAATLPAIMQAYAAYLDANWIWLLASTLFNLLGGIAILLLIFDGSRPTVGAAILGSVQILPFYFLASLLSGLILMLGFNAFIIPALYLYGRLAPLGPVVVAEGRRNPVEAIMRCFAITRGHGWSIFGLIFIISIAAGLVSFAISAVLGIGFMLLLGAELGKFLSLIVTTALQTLLTILLVVVTAAIYRALAEDSVARQFD